jgi:hypothetical protein
MFFFPGLEFDIDINRQFHSQVTLLRAALTGAMKSTFLILLKESKQYPCVT